MVMTVMADDAVLPRLETVKGTVRARSCRRVAPANGIPSWTTGRGERRGSSAAMAASVALRCSAESSGEELPASQSTEETVRSVTLTATEDPSTAAAAARPEATLSSLKVERLRSAS